MPKVKPEPFVLYEVPVTVTMTGKIKVKVYPERLDNGQTQESAARDQAEEDAYDGWALTHFEVDETEAGAGEPIQVEA